jgi:ADP-heptose:LPS heptosyltransferase
MLEQGEVQRILVVRRDNIGDLVCTTPLLTALRMRFPHAQLAALTNSYNLPVLAHNPDLDAVHAYVKLKHRPPERSLLHWLWHDRLGFSLAIRRQKFDLVVLAAPDFNAGAAKLARITGAQDVLGVTPDGRPGHGINLVASVPPAARHEVERVFAVANMLGIAGEPPPLKLAPATVAVEQMRRHFARSTSAPPLIGVHISARKPSQRWPAERFAKLLRNLKQSSDCHFALFWSPGTADNPLHPGDDETARRLLDGLGDIPVTPLHTNGLEALIAGLAVCDMLICSDGGAMHLAAALRIPIVCMFGDSDAARWHPWGVDYELLQTPSREVIDIGVETVVAACGRILARSARFAD